MTKKNIFYTYMIKLKYLLFCAMAHSYAIDRVHVETKANIHTLFCAQNNTESFNINTPNLESLEESLKITQQKFEALVPKFLHILKPFNFFLKGVTYSQSTATTESNEYVIIPGTITISFQCKKINGIRCFFIQASKDGIIIVNNLMAKKNTAAGSTNFFEYCLCSPPPPRK